jgi:hypothetical protein
MLACVAATARHDRPGLTMIGRSCSHRGGGHSDDERRARPPARDCDAGAAARSASPAPARISATSWSALRRSRWPRRPTHDRRRPGFEFCPASGDGIVFKRGDNDFRFFDARRTDQPDGDDDAGLPDKCRKHFRWKNKNEPHTAGTTYEYLIRFTGPARQSCVKDPFVRNG